MSQPTVPVSQELLDDAAPYRVLIRQAWDAVAYPRTQLEYELDQAGRVVAVRPYVPPEPSYCDCPHCEGHL